jgi:hypothetical protein
MEGYSACATGAAAPPPRVCRGNACSELALALASSPSPQ